MNRFFGLKFLIAVCIPLILSGCGDPEEVEVIKEVPVYLDKLAVTYSAPDADSRCTCEESRAAFLSNNDSVNSRYGEIQTTVRDANAISTIIDQFTDGKTIVFNGNEFLGCTIYTVTGGPSCGRVNEYALLDDVAVKQNTSKFLASFGPYYVNDIASCVATCKAGGADCLAMGAAGTPLVAPFLPMLDAANAKGGDVVRKADILKKYNLDPNKELCERGDLLVTDTEIINESDYTSELCNISLDGYEEFNFSVDIQTTVPPIVRALKANEQAKALSSSFENSNTAIAFSERDVSPGISFHEVDSKTKLRSVSTQLTDLYGGRVRKVARIDGKVIMATANGCISVDEN